MVAVETAAPRTIRYGSDKAVAAWLLVIAAMIALMVLVGGLTRLTGSGLSITEWRPVTGAIPPLSDADWQTEFTKYQGTPQYDLLNRGMGLAAFKTIYWWEWTHRLLGRLIGAAFALPFAVFLWQRRIDRALAVRLGVIFLFGAAQGALGWWMVQSGLEGARVAVSQYRLAAHLGLAIVLFGYVLWTALEVIGVRPTNVAGASRFRTWVLVLAGLVFVQILLGAFVAGLDAGQAFSSWPTYGGAWVPPGLYDLAPWWINHFESHALVHFQHRTMGYAVALMALWLFHSVRRIGPDKPLRLAGIHVIVLTALQIALGVFTVVSGVALPLAALHQIVALALFACVLWWAYVLRPRQADIA
jgi:cytochrome c oxidase assembly protein subunit 15